MVQAHTLINISGSCFHIDFYSPCSHISGYSIELDSECKIQTKQKKRPTSTFYMCTDTRPCTLRIRYTTSILFFFFHFFFFFGNIVSRLYQINSQNQLIRKFRNVALLTPQESTYGAQHGNRTYMSELYICFVCRWFTADKLCELNCS